MGVIKSGILSPTLGLGGAILGLKFLDEKQKTKIQQTSMKSNQTRLLSDNREHLK